MGCCSDPSSPTSRAADRKADRGAPLARHGPGPTPLRERSRTIRTVQATNERGRYPSENYLEAGSHLTVDDNEPANVDALTARGGFLADLGMTGPDAVPDLAQRHRELQARYRGIIDRLPAVLYIDGVNDGDTMVDVGPGIID